MSSFALELAQLRHAYSHLAAGRVVRQQEFADGLIAPIIRRLEVIASGAKPAERDSSRDELLSKISQLEAELKRRDEERSHLPALKAAGGWRAIESAPKETSLGELRQWCETRAIECGTKAEDRTIAERLRLGWAMSADALACVIEKIDDMNPANASDGSLALGAVPEGGEERNSSSVERAEAAPCGATDGQRTAGLARFAVSVLESLWEGYGLDPEDVQDLGIKHGLVYETTYDPDEHIDVHGVDATRGDPWFMQAAWVAELARSSEAPSPQSEPKASAGNSGLDEPLPPARPYSAASRP